MVDPVGPKIWEMRRAIMHDRFPARFCPRGSIHTNSAEDGMHLSPSEIRELWRGAGGEDSFKRYVLWELTSTYNVVVSFQTMPSAHSRLAWDVLFLLGHALSMSNSKVGCDFVYNKALDISEAERDRIERGGEQEDHIPTHYMANHHLHAGENALHWEHPNVNLAERALGLGELK
jgi:hypothetical protein